MHIQVNTDDNVTGDESLARWVEDQVRDTLGRFSDQVTRIEVHLSDTNAAKPGSDDKRCMVEARLAGRRPEAVSHNADTMRQAVDGAMKKLARVLDGTKGKQSDHKGAPSIRHEGGI
jgi:ribosomal subunit interface protein